MNKRAPEAVVLLNMGGPDSLEAVRPFLMNLFSDRQIIRLGPRFMQRFIAWMIVRRRAPKSMENYRRIGGSSPLNEITRAQAEALCSLLEKEAGSGRFVCRVGMRYWHPRTPDVLKELKEQGIKQVVGLSLYPHYCHATGGSSIWDFEQAARRLEMSSRVIDRYPDHPGYIEALLQCLKRGVEAIGRDQEFTLVYSAHSLPVEMIEQGDPYLDQLKQTISALEARSGIKGRLCFQSRSGPVKWLEPATDHMLNSLADQGVKNILCMPISFVSDHIETLYEIDMLYGDMMKKRGVRLVRTPSINDAPPFIGALADMVLRAGERAAA